MWLNWSKRLSFVDMWITVVKPVQIVNTDEQQCRIQNTYKETAYASSEIDFLTGLLTNVGGFICHNSKVI